MVIRGAGDDGLLTVAKLASSRAQDARGQRVRVLTASGEVRGVVVAPHEGEVTWDALRIDVGALDRESALELVRPGDGVALVGPPEELPNGRVLSGALDDRVGSLRVPRSTEADRCGSARLGRCGRRLGAGGDGDARRRAGSSRSGSPPTSRSPSTSRYAGDAPGTAPWGDVRLGGGPTVFRGPVVSPIVGDGLLAAGAAVGIELTIESGNTTYSDADDIFVAGRWCCHPDRLHPAALHAHRR